MALKSIKCYVNTKLKQLLEIMAKCKLHEFGAEEMRKSSKPVENQN